MPAITWAKTVRCDWPDCPSEAELTLGERWPDRLTPPGWIDLTIARITTHKGYFLQFFCTIHARKTLADLTALIGEVPREP